jgi:hypothetical protein
MLQEHMDCRQCTHSIPIESTPRGDDMPTARRPLVSRARHPNIPHTHTNPGLAGHVHHVVTQQSGQLKQCWQHHTTQPRAHPAGQPQPSRAQHTQQNRGSRVDTCTLKPSERHLHSSSQHLQLQSTACCTRVLAHPLFLPTHYWWHCKKHARITTSQQCGRTLVLREQPPQHTPEHTTPHHTPAHTTATNRTTAPGSGNSTHTYSRSRQPKQLPTPQHTHKGTPPSTHLHPLNRNQHSQASSAPWSAAAAAAAFLSAAFPAAADISRIGSGLGAGVRPQQTDRAGCRSATAH